jgi:hypothetical protein
MAESTTLVTSPKTSEQAAQSSKTGSMRRPSTRIGRAVSLDLRPAFFFWVELLYLTVLVVGAVVYAKQEGFRQLLPSSVGPVPLPVIWFGALGAVMIGLYGTFRHNADWDPTYNYWHLARPLTGSVIGVVGYLIFIAVINSAGGQTTNRPIAYVVAFLLGYREESFRNLLKKATDILIIPATTDGGQTPPAGTSGPGGPATGGPVVTTQTDVLSKSNGSSPATPSDASGDVMKSAPGNVDALTPDAVGTDMGRVEMSSEGDVQSPSATVAQPTDMTAHWNDWESLGGTLSSGPTAASWGHNRIDVFACGADNSLWHKARDGAWNSWEGLGGQLTSDPSGVSWGEGRIDVFGRGLDSALWHLVYEQGLWREWESLGGQLGSGPTVSSWTPGRLDVFFRGLDSALWHRAYDGVWHEPESLGGQFTSDPSAVSWAPNVIDVFVRGIDSGLWHRWYDGSWHDWEGLGGSLASGPGAASSEEGRLNVFARGMDGSLWQRWYDGAWHDWESLGDSPTSDPAAVSWSSAELDVFCRGSDSGLWHRSYTSGAL